MGNQRQKMMIAFNCFDRDRNQCIEAEEVQFFLKHVPLVIEESFHESAQLSNMPIEYLQKAKLKDFAEIDMIVSGIFEEYKTGMYFEEFCTFT